MGLKIQSEKALLVTRGKISRYGLITKSHKHVWCTGKLFTILPLTDTRTHTPTAAGYQGEVLVKSSGAIWCLAPC